MFKTLKERFAGQRGGDDADACLPLVPDDGQADGKACVVHLGADPNAALAEPMGRIVPSNTEVQAVARPAPVLIEIEVPQGNWEPGQIVKVGGPDGFIRVPLPAGGQPGTKAVLKIAPRPEYRVRVPPGVSPGGSVKFQTESGDQVVVVVPKGVQAGDKFEVTPPALMVRVPEGCAAGDSVVFRHRAEKSGGKAKEEFFRAQIPKGCEPGDFFSALMQPLIEVE